MVVKQLSKAVALMGDIAQAQSVSCTDTQVAGGNVYSLFQVDGESTFTRAMACRMKAPLRITADMLYSLMEPYRRSH